MDRPLISVGMTVYNAEHCVLETIRSIAAQTIEDWEMIIVDDGSTDSTVRVIESVKDPRITMLPADGKKLTIPARRNQTIDRANGKYYAVVDADDLCHPLRFEKQVGFLDDNPGIDVVGSAMCILDENSRPAFKASAPQTHADIFGSKFSGVRLANATVMARTEWFKKWKYDPSQIRGEDQELWLRSERESQYANIPECLYLCNEVSYASLKKYYIAQKCMASIVWKYASRESGRLRAARYVLEKYVKAMVYGVASLLGMREKMVSRRYDPLDPQEKQSIEEAVETIKNTAIPLQG